MKEKDEKSSDLLGVEIKNEVKDYAKMAVERIEKEEQKEIKSLHIDNLEEVMNRVKEIEEEKRLNPDVVEEGEAGSVIVEGEPKMIIDNEYVPYKEAQVILQTRKVVKEWLKLQRDIGEANKIIK